MVFESFSSRLGHVALREFLAVVVQCARCGGIRDLDPHFGLHETYMAVFLLLRPTSSIALLVQLYFFLALSKLFYPDAFKYKYFCYLG